MRIAKNAFKPAPVPLHDTIRRAQREINHDFVCAGGDVLPYFKDIFAAGHGGKVEVKEFPAEIMQRLEQALKSRCRPTTAFKSELPKYFPGTKVVTVNTNADFIAEGGRIGNHFKHIFKAGQELAANSELLAGYHEADVDGWMLIYTTKDTDLQKMAEFIEGNLERWDALDARDQLPGQECACYREFPVSALPGTEEAKRVFVREQYSGKEAIPPPTPEHERWVEREMELIERIRFLPHEEAQRLITLHEEKERLIKLHGESTGPAIEL